jgi:DNA mismatch repair protein MutL
MSPDVRILPQTLINKIAAGEVIVRPASVVKELVENAYDAGARHVRVEMSTDGRDIAVTDDGSGMDEPNAKRSLLRSSTSKIYDFEDLEQLLTRGFRGEALASIISVSRFEMLTRRAEDLAGTRITAEGGQVLKAGPVGAAPGTTIHVRELFYNTPARLKFLKTPAAEFGILAQLLTQQALSRPDVGLTLVRGGDVRFDLPASQDLRARVEDLLGGAVRGQLLPVDYARDGYAVRGYISRPEASRKDRRWQFLMVNGRPVAVRQFSFPIQQAYSGLLMQQRFPIVVLDVQVDLAQVDVNVHPTKDEVRFEDERRVAGMLHRAVHQALMEHSLMPTLEMPRPPEPGGAAQDLPWPGGQDAGATATGNAAAVNAAAAGAASAKATMPPEGLHDHMGWQGEGFQEGGGEGLQARGPHHNVGDASQARGPHHNVGDASQAGGGFAAEDRPMGLMSPIGPIHPIGPTGPTRPTRPADDPTLPFLYSPHGVIPPGAGPGSGFRPPSPGPVAPFDAVAPATRDLFPPRVFVQPPAEARPGLAPTVGPYAASLGDPSGLSLGDGPPPLPLGQVGRSYIVAEWGDDLLLVDQHAAHERLLYQQLLERPREPVPRQPLLIPVPLEVAPAERDAFEMLAPLLAEMGVDVARDAAGDYGATSLPADLDGLDAPALVRDMLDDLAAAGGDVPGRGNAFAAGGAAAGGGTPAIGRAPTESDATTGRDVTRLREQLLVRMACHAAIKAGQALHPSEMARLLKDLAAARMSFTCPHGRPTMVVLRRDQLDRQFGRKQ